MYIVLFHMTHVKHISCLFVVYFYILHKAYRNDFIKKVYGTTPAKYRQNALK